MNTPLGVVGSGPLKCRIEIESRPLNWMWEMRIDGWDLVRTDSLHVGEQF